MRALALLAAIALAGCDCNSVTESVISFECRWQTPAKDVEGSTVKVCMNNVCSAGAFGAGGSATATSTQLAGDLGYLTADLAADPIGAAVTITTSGGDGSYQDGDVWGFAITPPTASGFDASTPVTYVSHDQECGGPDTYQTLHLVLTMTP